MAPFSTNPMPTVKFKGVPGSPYTRKMLAYLRFRHIPYELLIGDQSNSQDLPEAKVSLLPTFYLPNSEGELEAVVDSTPLIRRFEEEYLGRSTLPNNPALNFINYLVEDFADEWLTKAMFHYRWHYEADIETAGRILPRWTNFQAPEEQLREMQNFIAQRQISRLYVVGSNEITAPVIEASYRRILTILDKLIEKQIFVFGSRPSAADFGIYAQLTQLAKFDPTPAAICMDMAPRVHAWTDFVDDLSGQNADDDDWLEINALSSSLQPLLTEIGKTYAPALLANALAMNEGAAEMQTEIDGQLWQQPTFPYQAKCLQSINIEYHRLDDEAKQQVDAMLDGTGCESIILK